MYTLLCPDWLGVRENKELTDHPTVPSYFSCFINTYFERTLYLEPTLTTIRLKKEINFLFLFA